MLVSKPVAEFMVTPVGIVPDNVKCGAGVPVAVTVNNTAITKTKPVLEALVKAGAAVTTVINPIPMQPACTWPLALLKAGQKAVLLALPRFATAVDCDG